MSGSATKRGHAPPTAFWWGEIVHRSNIFWLTRIISVQEFRSEYHASIKNWGYCTLFEQRTNNVHWALSWYVIHHLRILSGYSIFPIFHNDQTVVMGNRIFHFYGFFFCFKEEITTWIRIEMGIIFIVLVYMVKLNNSSCEKLYRTVKMYNGRFLCHEITWCCIDIGHIEILCLTKVHNDEITPFQTCFSTKGLNILR